MQGKRVLEFALDEKLKNPLAMPELAIEVFIRLIRQFRRDRALPIVIPIRVNSDQQMRLFPFDGVAVNVSLAGVGRIEPEAEETILPGSRCGVVRAGDQPGVRCPDRLARQRFTNPNLPLPHVI